MTVAVSVKVHDGLVLASDSATTLTAADGRVVNVFNNANKVFNLFRGVPIGGMTWGKGSIGAASISTLAKDLRLRFMGKTCVDVEWNRKWHLDKDNICIRTVAELTKEFFYDEMYVSAYKDNLAQNSLFGFLVAGYSSGAPLPEEWLIIIDEQGQCTLTQNRQGEDWGVAAWAITDAISRIMNGYDPGLVPLLEGIMTSGGVDRANIDVLISIIHNSFHRPLVYPPMPIQDAINLANFLVEATISYVKFNDGAETVGGPVEIATITKHEGFKWVQRKHFFDPKYNPPEPSGLNC